MQDNLINPQSVNEVIQTLFGSYEKFVLNMINRRKELQDEKLQLTQRLKEIEKEEGFIKSVLTGAPNKKSTQHKVLDPGKNSPHLKEKLLKNQKEEELIKKALSGFHGKKINGKFFNSESNSLESTKPQKSAMGEQTSSFQAIGDYLAFKKEEYNKEAMQDLINEQTLHSKPTYKPENSLLITPDKSYKNEVISILKSEYLLSNLDLKAIDNNELSKANKNGLPPHEFVANLAKNLNLEKVQYKQGKRL